MRRSSSSLSIFLLCSILLSLLLQIQPSHAQFGIKKGTPISKPGGGGVAEEIEIDPATGLPKEPPQHQQQQQKEGFLSEKDAADMSAIIEEAMKDVETMAMITKLKEENSEHLDELRKLSPMEVLGGMKETLDNMKLIEYLFKDKEKAVKEMEKEG